MQFLVVDDHDLVCETIAAFLDHEGLGGVDTAPGLEDALEKLAANGGYDLVLLDYDMPGMNGLAGLTRVQSANNGRPVALISGTASPEVARMALEAGAAGLRCISEERVCSASFASSCDGSGALRIESEASVVVGRCGCSWV